VALFQEVVQSKSPDFPLSTKAAPSSRARGSAAVGALVTTQSS